MTFCASSQLRKSGGVDHLNALPILTIRDQVLNKFNDRVRKIIALRDEAHAATIEAEVRFEDCFGPVSVSDTGELGFVVQAAKSLFGDRRRMDALPHNPAAATIYKHLQRRGRGFSRLGGSGFRIWLPNRFRRVPADDGVELMDSSELFEINPDIKKRIADRDFGDANRGRVEAGWLLLARSGQVYGLIGSLVLGSEALADKVISDHVIRIAPGERAQMRTGYVLVALSHPTLGRPLVKSLPYGSSIPEIDPGDFARIEIVRLAASDENAIADLAEKSVKLRGRADTLENEVAGDAEAIIDRFIAGDVADIMA